MQYIGMGFKDQGLSVPSMAPGGVWVGGPHKGWEGEGVVKRVLWGCCCTGIIPCRPLAPQMINIA